MAGLAVQTSSHGMITRHMMDGTISGDMQRFAHQAMQIGGQPRSDPPPSPPSFNSSGRPQTHEAHHRPHRSNLLRASCPSGWLPRELLPPNSKQWFTAASLVPSNNATPIISDSWHTTPPGSPTACSARATTASWASRSGELCGTGRLWSSPFMGRQAERPQYPLSRSLQYVAPPPPPPPDSPAAAAALCATAKIFRFAKPNEPGAQQPALETKKAQRHTPRPSPAPPARTCSSPPGGRSSSHRRSVSPTYRYLSSSARTNPALRPQSTGHLRPRGFGHVLYLSRHQLPGCQSVTALGVSLDSASEHAIHHTTTLHASLPSQHDCGGQRMTWLAQQQQQQQQQQDQLELTVLAQAYSPTTHTPYTVRPQHSAQAAGIGSHAAELRPSSTSRQLSPTGRQGLPTATAAGATAVVARRSPQMTLMGSSDAHGTSAVTSARPHAPPRPHSSLGGWTDDHAAPLGELPLATTIAGDDFLTGGRDVGAGNDVGGSGDRAAADVGSADDYGGGGCVTAAVADAASGVGARSPDGSQDAMPEPGGQDDQQLTVELSVR